jgi:hypothetical protein
MTFSSNERFIGTEVVLWNAVCKTQLACSPRDLNLDQGLQPCVWEDADYHYLKSEETLISI